METIALLAAAAALAAALVLGVVRLGPPLASVLGHALSGVVTPAVPTAPGLDDLERAVLAAATSADDDGPTLLDVRTRLRTRLERTVADAAFTAIVRPLVARTLAAGAISSEPVSIAIVDRAAEDDWVRDRVRVARALGIAELAGPPGALLALVRDFGLGGLPADAFPPGRAAGDVVVKVAGGGYTEVVLRRRPERGLTVIHAMREAGGPATGGLR